MLMSERTYLLAIAALLGCVGCKPAVDVANPSPFEEDDPSALEASEMARARQEAATSSTPQVARDPLSDPGPATGTVTRASLNAVLDSGIGALLSGIEVHPKLDLRDRFIGWEVVRLSYKWADIRPGDVISDVNGRPISRPDELQALWDALRTADSIVVRGERSGSPFELHFDVVGDAASTP
jgi:S1-C subfamily serine protease